METKNCSYCKLNLPLEDFHKSKGHSYGRTAVCKTCQAAYSAKWYQENKERLIPMMRSNAYFRQYNFTVEEYDLLYEEQNQGCAICTSPTGANNKRLAVDHNHQTGEVRGLLCDDCNIGLGKFKDNPSLLAKAINYLS